MINIGDKDGIAVWDKLGSSTDPQIKDYFKALGDAASKYGVVWFQDLIEQMAGNGNQISYQVEWNGNDWVFNVFHVPENVKGKRAVLNINTRPPPLPRKK